MLPFNFTKRMTIRGFVSANLNLIIALNKNGYKYSDIASQFINFGDSLKNANSIKHYVCAFKKKNLEDIEEVEKYTNVINEALKADIFNTLQVVEKPKSIEEQITTINKVILTDDNLKSAVVSSLPNVNPKSIDADERYEYVMSLFDVSGMDETSKKGLRNNVIRKLETLHTNDKDSLKLFAHESFKNYEKQNLKFNQ